MHSSSTALLLAAFALLGTSLSSRSAETPRPPEKAMPCVGCHGSSKAPPLGGMPTLEGQQADFLVLQMFLMREGLRHVPEMEGVLKGFSDKDLSEVAAHFAKSDPPPLASKADLKLRSRGEAIARTMGCGSCHLENYQGQRQIPALAGQREDYLAKAMRAYRDNKRAGSDTSMNAIMYQVPDPDIAALAHYFAHLK